MSFAIPPPPVLKEGWLKKESRWFRNWNWRFVVILRNGILRTYTSQPRQGFANSASNCRARSPAITSSFVQALADEGSPRQTDGTITDELSIVGGLCEPAGTRASWASAVSFRFTVTTCDGRTLWFSAATEASQIEWLESIKQASCKKRNVSRQETLRPRSLMVFRSSPPQQETASRSVSSACLSPRSGGAAVTNGYGSRDGAAGKTSVDRQTKSTEVFPTIAGGQRARSLDAGVLASHESSAAISGQIEQCDAAARSSCLESVVSVSAPKDPPGSPKTVQSPSLPQQLAPRVSPTKQRTGSAKGKGKSSGKAPPPPPKGLGRGAGKSKGKGTSGRPYSAPLGSPRLPIGRRLTLLGIGAADDTTQVSSSKLESSGGDGVGLPMADLAELQKAFAPVVRPVLKKKAALTVTRVALLPLSVAQNVAIVLKKLNVSTEKLADALSRLDPSVYVVGGDVAARLLDVWPSPQMLQSLVDYTARGGDVARLRDVEQRMLPLATMRRMGQRLRIMVMSSTFAERSVEAQRQLGFVQKACRELCSSVLLKELRAVVLVVYNYVNFGTGVREDGGCDPLQNVDVRSLVRLRETKAYNGDFEGFNMLHFVLKQLQREKPESKLAHLEAELITLPRAANARIERLRHEFAQLRTEQAFVLEELSEFRSAYEEQKPQDEIVEMKEVQESPAQMVVVEECEVEVSEMSEREDKEAQEMDLRLAREVARPPVRKRRTLMQRVLGPGMDLASLVRSRFRGEEFTSLPDFVAAEENGGFKPVLSPNGEPPPPGWLWLLKPSQRWQQCWAEVRGPFLVVYRTTNKRFAGGTFAMLAGAKVTAFASEEASDEGRELAAVAPYGFEVNLRGDFPTLWLCARQLVEAERWVSLLTEQSQIRGAGFLDVYDAGRPAFDSRQHFCCFRDGMLCCWLLAQDALKGKIPSLTWRLGDATAVRSLWGQGASPAALAMEFGFEVETADGACWQFSCESYADEQAWLVALLGLESLEKVHFRTCETTVEDFLGDLNSVQSQASPGDDKPQVAVRAESPERLGSQVPGAVPATGPAVDGPSLDLRCDSVEGGGSDVNDIGAAMEATFAGRLTRAEKFLDAVVLATPESSTPFCGEGPPPCVDENRSLGGLAAEGSTRRAKPVISRLKLPLHGGGESQAALMHPRKFATSETAAMPSNKIRKSTPRSTRFSAPSNKPLLRQESTFSEGACGSDTDSDSDRSAISDHLGGGEELSNVPDPTPRCIGCVERLEMICRDMEKEIDELQNSLEVTEDECRAVLKFFGLEVSDSPTCLFMSASQLFESLATFLRQVRSAWEELNKRGCGSAKPTSFRRRTQTLTDAHVDGDSRGPRASSGRRLTD
eukprot:TRINITY_DN28981_c0_g1_i1.p1 TRINITY_DN28981_c0_g1~~TRINITY_DN28981_c0_g1_i1.p1  ORF type:complete len:1352 (+),score=275.52 TRINITY_DN28981_c0_g1_i1:133-4188(+)